MIPRLILFTLISAAVSTPLQLFNSIVIEGMKGPPDFVSVPFLIYALCAKIVFGSGYVIFGYKIPVKSTILRAFTYMLLILLSSYLPNVLGMAGGDGAVIDSAFSVGIVIVDTISYMLDGLILGFLMRRYKIEPSTSVHNTNITRFIPTCVIIGILFALLNLIFDLAAGAAGSSLRLANMLMVTHESQTVFYVVFTAFMFIAGLLQPLWYRLCLPEEITSREALTFALKLGSSVWLPCVLIMVFFGTPVIGTLTYGLAYLIMFAVCGPVYKKLSSKA